MVPVQNSLGPRKREPHEGIEKIVPVVRARLHLSGLEDADFILRRELPGGRGRRHEADRRAAAAHPLADGQRIELVVPGKPVLRQASEKMPQRRENRRIERASQVPGGHPPASRHPTDSPARSGTSVAAPKAISPGTVQVSLRKVIEPALRGSR